MSKAPPDHTPPPRPERETPEGCSSPEVGRRRADETIHTSYGAHTSSVLTSSVAPRLPGCNSHSADCWPAFCQAPGRPKQALNFHGARYQLSRVLFSTDVADLALAYRAAPTFTCRFGGLLPSQQPRLHAPVQTHVGLARQAAEPVPQEADQLC